MLMMSTFPGPKKRPDMLIVDFLLENSADLAGVGGFCRGVGGWVGGGWGGGAALCNHLSKFCWD